MIRMQRLLRERAHRGDDGFAMIFTLLLMFVVVATTIAVAGVLISQVKPTQYAKKSVRTGDAAEAGLQAALGQLRNTQTNGGGDLTKLPCSDPRDSSGVSLVVGSPNQSVTVAGDQITGTVASDGQSANTATYRAVIAYYANDPTSHENDASTSWWSTNAIKCKAGIVDSVPTYAFIQSFGAGAQPGGLSASQANRTVHGVYQFSSTNTNTVGGRMVEFNSSPAMCLDAGASPTAGTVPTMQSCLALGTARQTWLYRADLSIQYGGDISQNLCIENMSGTPKLESCTGTGSGATYPFASSDQQNQEWAFNDNGHLSAPSSPYTGSSGGDVTEGTGGTCLQPSSSDSSQASAGQALLATSCSSSTTGLTAWNPDPQFGAGKAGGNTSGSPGSPTNQFVNYAELGRCLDVTGQNVGADHLIDYPCKQAPNSCLLTWNQVWTYTAVSGGYGTFSTQYAGGRKACDTGGYTNYCLNASGGVGTWVTVTQCSSTPPDSQLWDATGYIAGNYPGSYLLINKSSGLCMGADPSTQPTYLSSTMVLANCDGTSLPSASSTKNSLLLKWNAPANPATPGLSNIQEDSGSTLTHSG